MINILLVHPPITTENIYLSFKDAGSHLPPLGLCYLAANLRKQGISVKILDCQAEKLDIAGAIRRIKELIPNPQSAIRNPQSIIGISSYSNFLGVISQFAKEIKKELPDILIIIGGGGITAQPQEVMQKYPEFDIGVIGEGEETLTELLIADCGLRIENLHQSPPISTNLKDIKGIIYRENGNIIQNEKRPFIENLDYLPLPAFELLPHLPKYYSPPLDSLNRLPSASLITSRGCPGKCIFCNKTLFGNITRSHSASYTLEMIKILKNDFKIKEIFFQDDTIFVHKNILKELCEKIIKEKVNISWCCYGRVDMVDKDILHIMKKAGCWQISYGIETASDEILKFTQKGTSRQMIKDAINLTHSCGIKAKGLFMLGNFLETENTIKGTIKLIKELPLSDFHLTYFTPYPGSISYSIAKDYGKFEDDLDKLNFFSPSFIPKGLTEEKLKYYYKKIYLTFYFRPKIILYYLRKIKTPTIFFRLLKTLIYFLKR